MAAIVPKLAHPRLGFCELVRIEGTDWIVRAASTGVHYRVPPEKRSQFQPAENSPRLAPSATRHSPTPLAKTAPDVVGAGISSGQPIIRPPPPPRPVRKTEEPGHVASRPEGMKSPPPPHARILLKAKEASPETEFKRGALPTRDDALAQTVPNVRLARRVIESLRVGLPSIDGSTRHLAVGFDEVRLTIDQFLGDTAASGAGLLVNGAYGEGKTFSLRILEHAALDGGFIAARAEIDPLECPINKPHLVYRQLLRSMRAPGQGDPGIAEIIDLANDRLLAQCGCDPDARYFELARLTDCPPLAWILSDPEVLAKPRLLSLLNGELGSRVGCARQSHCRPLDGKRLWPSFYARNQGDFAVYILSGLSRLARALEYRGLVVILDEAEKYFQLTGDNEAFGASFLRGLIWAATAPERRRARSHEPAGILHSYLNGGYPFTTEFPANLGVAIAMTPGHDRSPVEVFGECGRLLAAQVPSLTENRLREYCARVVPFFARAYGVAPPDEESLKAVAALAIRLWRQEPYGNTRSGVQAAVAAFDRWRETR